MPASIRAWTRYTLLGGVYSALLLLGVCTASNSVLALVWPANAFMIAMLVRFPATARLPGWIACLAGLGVAVLFAGFGLGETARLAIYNFGIVGIGYGLLSRLNPVDQRLERPSSVFYLLSAVIAASTFAGISSSLLIGDLFSTPAFDDDLRYWFSVEVLNQLAFMPMILAFPKDRQWARHFPLSLHEQAPMIVLVLSAVVGVFFGGLAALAFPVPALFLCAISYRTFLTALLTFTFCAWTVIATALGYVELSNINQSLVLSFTMGRALITLGPLIISTTTATRKEVVDQLRYLAAEREIISNELEHRIKNLFALVNGLISLSVRDYPNMRPLANALRNRLIALQNAHELVGTGKGSAGSTGGLISLQQLIGVLLRPYEGGAEKRFVVGGDDALIDAGIATALALVFHELATNSTKYGALGCPGGALEVRVKRHVDDLHIEWTERISGPTDQPEIVDSGFGSRLLDVTIGSQLGGTYTTTRTAGGMSISIALPGRLFHDIRVGA